MTLVRSRECHDLEAELYTHIVPERSSLVRVLCTVVKEAVSLRFAPPTDLGKVTRKVGSSSDGTDESSRWHDGNQIMNGVI